MEKQDEHTGYPCGGACHTKRARRGCLRLAEALTGVGLVLARVWKSPGESLGPAARGTAPRAGMPRDMDGATYVDCPPGRHGSWVGGEVLLWMVLLVEEAEDGGLGLGVGAPLIPSFCRTTRCTEAFDLPLVEGVALRD